MPANNSIFELFIDNVQNPGQRSGDPGGGLFTQVLGGTGLGFLGSGDNKGRTAGEHFLKNLIRHGYGPAQRGDILSQIFAGINTGLQTQMQGARANLASQGLDPRSGLGQSQMASIRRSGNDARGKAVADFNIQEMLARLQAAQILASRQKDPSGLEKGLGLASNFIPLLG